MVSSLASNPTLFWKEHVIYIYAILVVGKIVPDLFRKTWVIPRNDVIQVGSVVKKLLNDKNKVSPDLREKISIAAEILREAKDRDIVGSDKRLGKGHIFLKKDFSLMKARFIRIFQKTKMHGFT